MHRDAGVFLATVSLALAVLACNTVMGGGSNAIMSDDFSVSTNGWGTETDTNSSIEYANNTLQMILFTPNYFVWSAPPGNIIYQNVHIEVTVINNETDPTTAFGIICNQQAIRDNFYYVAMRPAGQYAIARAVEGQSDLFLTNNDQWAFSDLIPQNAPSYRVGADCGNGTVILYVNGQQIASAADSSYLSGGVALFTHSGEEVNSVNVAFDDFLVMELP